MATFPPPTPPSSRTPVWLVLLVLQSLFSLAVGITAVAVPKLIFGLIHPEAISSLEPSQRFVAEEMLRWFGLMVAAQGLTWLRLRKNKGIAEVLLVALLGQLALGFLVFKFTETFGKLVFNIQLLAVGGVMVSWACLQLFTIFSARRWFSSVAVKKTA